MKAALSGSPPAGGGRPALDFGAGEIITPQWKCLIKLFEIPFHLELQFVIWNYNVRSIHWTSHQCSSQVRTKWDQDVVKTRECRGPDKTMKKSNIKVTLKQNIIICIFLISFYIFAALTGILNNQKKKQLCFIKFKNEWTKTVTLMLLLCHNSVGLVLTVLDQKPGGRPVQDWVKTQ